MGTHDDSRGITDKGTESESRAVSERAIAGEDRSLTQALAAQGRGEEAAQENVASPRLVADVRWEFEQLPFKAAICSSSERTRWCWNPASSFHSVRTFVLNVQADVHVSQTRGKPRMIWKVGFVQNLLSDRLRFKFKGSDERAIGSTRKLLDQVDFLERFEEPWYSIDPHPTPQLTTWAYFDAAVDKSVRLAMNDVPTSSYCHFQGGKSHSGEIESGQLEQVTRIKNFGLWIMARPALAPAEQLSSYVVVSRHRWFLSHSFKVTRGPGRPSHIALPEVGFDAPTGDMYLMKEPIIEPGLDTGLTANIWERQYWEEARDVIPR